MCILVVSGKGIYLLSRWWLGDICIRYGHRVEFATFRTTLRATPLQHHNGKVLFRSPSQDRVTNPIQTHLRSSLLPTSTTSTLIVSHVSPRQSPSLSPSSCRSTRNSSINHSISAIVAAPPMALTRTVHIADVREKHRARFQRAARCGGP